MKLDKPLYADLPCFDGMEEKRIKYLVSKAYQVNRKLKYFALFLLVVGIGLLAFGPEIIESVLHVERIWSLSICISILIPFAVYESTNHRKRMIHTVEMLIKNERHNQSMEEQPIQPPRD